MRESVRGNTKEREREEESVRVRDRESESERENFSMVIAHCMSTGNKTESPSPPVKSQ